MAKVLKKNLHISPYTKWPDKPVWLSETSLAGRVGHLGPEYGLKGLMPGLCHTFARMAR